MSMAPFFGVPGKLKLLLDRLTATRAGYLDNLDAAISTRAAASTAISSATWTSGRAAKLDNLDAAISSIIVSPIRSVQRGSTYIAGSTIDVTITSVNMAKSFVSFGGSTGTLDTGCTIRLYSSTVVRLFSYDTGKTLSWEVIEYV